MTKAEAKAMLKRIQEPEAWEPQINQAAFEALDMAIEALDCSEFPNNSDIISRQQAIDAISCNITITGRQNAELVAATIGAFADRIKALPSAEPETCEGCKHLGKWENEFEYGYPSPCTRCKRRVEDHYER